MSTLRSLFTTGRTALFPLTRTALVFLGWKHRHTVLLWFRSLRHEISTVGVEPARLRLLLSGLWAVSSDRRTTNAEPLRMIAVRSHGFEVEARAGWIGRATVEHLLAQVAPPPTTMTAA